MYTLTDSAYQLLKRDIQRILESCKHHEQFRNEKPDFTDLRFDEATVCLRPQDYFHFQFGRFYICLVRNKVSEVYSLQCYRWIPADFECVSNFSLVDKQFGRFHSVNEALEAFYKECKRCMDYCLEHPVEYMQLEIF